MLKYIALRLWVQIKDLYLLFFRRAIIVAGYVDDNCTYGVRHRNWGDELNYYLLRYLTGRGVFFYVSFWPARHLHLKNYLCIGTLLDAVNYSTPQTIVWGGGAAGHGKIVPPKKILSVRGPLTRRYLQQKGIDCPECYGDPALILPLFYQPENNGKKYKLGLIPHVVDQQHPLIQEVHKHHPEILVIDLGHYDCWTDVIDQICSCEVIASSSLHGLIVSDTYGVPNCWAEFTGNISGGYFKFHDYAASVGRDFDKPLQLQTFADIDNIFSIAAQWRPIMIDRKAILNACPFKIKAKEL